jgi:hypothetical protein
MLRVHVEVLLSTLRWRGSVGDVISSSTDTGDSGDAGVAGHDPIDLAAIEAELDGVQAALTRLADGTYWTDEVSGDQIPDEVLASTPLARRA